LGGWGAARDFWWIAGRERFLKLAVQLLVKFPLFALLARLFLLMHNATSVQHLMFAVANSALINMLMASGLVFGMSREGVLTPL
jgi:hypothetical protein